MTIEMAAIVRVVLYTVVFLWVFHEIHGAYHDSSVLAHYRLDGSDTNINFTNITFVNGRYPGSKAVRFNQSDSFVSTPQIEINRKNFTIACWIKLAFLRSFRQVIFGDWFRPWQFQLAVHPNTKVYFEHHRKSGFQWWNISGGEVHVNQWTHVAVTWKRDEGLSQLYVDAVEVKRHFFGSDDIFYGRTGHEYLIGNDGHRYDHQFYGDIMDLYVLDVALSRDELNHLRGFPKLTTPNAEEMTLYENEILKCRAEGVPSPNVTWLHNAGHIVDNETSLEILKIPKAGENSEASYKCVASNQLGETSKVVNITVVGPFELCTKYNTIDDVTRSVNHPFQAPVFAETVDTQIWYRLSGKAGSQLPTRCVTTNRCGSQATGWLNGKYPDVKDGVVQRKVCFNLNGECCGYQATVQIRKCFEGFYVHKFESLPRSVRGRYCATVFQEKKEFRSTPIFISTLDTVGFALKGHVMYTLEHVSDPALCMSYCNLLVECDSFNFSPQDQICELNNATKETDGADYKPVKSFIFYEKAGQSVKAGETWCEW